jgi:hypothetical protein
MIITILKKKSLNIRGRLVRLLLFCTLFSNLLELRAENRKSFSKNEAMIPETKKAAR